MTKDGGICPPGDGCPLCDRVRQKESERKLRRVVKSFSAPGAKDDREKLIRVIEWARTSLTEGPEDYALAASHVLTILGAHDES